jgi:hypothetical protein
MENTNEAQLINLEHELLPPHNLAAPDIPKQSHRELWNELIKENEDIRKEVEEYKQSKLQELEAPPHPIIEYLNETVFPVLNSALIKMLKKVKDQENQIFTEGDTYLNSLNYISEYLWNMNPQHPERKEKWTEISNIGWI